MGDNGHRIFIQSELVYVPVFMFACYFSAAVSSGSVSEHVRLQVPCLTVQALTVKAHMRISESCLKPNGYSV